METTLIDRLRGIARELRPAADFQASEGRFKLAADIMGVMSQINRLANRLESHQIEPEPPQKKAK